MATFVIAHGAWSAGWAWRKMRPRLRALGHEIFTPTYTGIGERVHLASRDVRLDTHIEDVIRVLEFEDLSDIVLLGHSYGGMVATGVADRASGRIAKLVYLDAFVPRDGQSLFDLQVPDGRERMVAAVRTDGEGWRVPPNPLPPDTPPEDMAWANPRRVPQPIGTFEQPIHLTGAVDALPRTYIYCTKAGPGDVFGQFARRAREEPGWRYLELAASHNPHITMPDDFAQVLDQIGGRAGSGGTTGKF